MHYTMDIALPNELKGESAPTASSDTPTRTARVPNEEGGCCAKNQGNLITKLSSRGNNTDAAPRRHAHPATHCALLQGFTPRNQVRVVDIAPQQVVVV
jgi:hypothetical protein